MTAISTLMTRSRLITIGPEATVSDAARTLQKAGISHLLVTGDHDDLLGVFCVCDLDRAATGTCLRQHLHAKPVTVDMWTESDVALDIMEQKHLSCLPVVDAGRLRGVITLHDMRRMGLVDGEDERCSACGSSEHVRCSHKRPVSLCFECARKSEPPNFELELEAELGGGD